MGTTSIAPVPPEARPPEPEDNPGMFMAAGQKAQLPDTTGPQAVQQLAQTLVKFRDSASELLQQMQQVSPQSVALFEPIIQAGKAIEEVVKKFAQKIGDQKKGSPTMPEAPPPNPVEGAAPPIAA